MVLEEHQIGRIEDGRLDSQYYLDWVMSLERYFKWYGMSQERRVRFAAMKLVGILVKC